jgi:hypothetical protein
LAINRARLPLSTALAVEAVPAVDRPIAARLEGDFGLLAALGADGREELSRATEPAATAATTSAATTAAAVTSVAAAEVAAGRGVTATAAALLHRQHSAFRSDRRWARHDVQRVGLLNPRSA